MNKTQFASVLTSFVDNKLLSYEFDDLISSKYSDPTLESYREELIRLPDIFPPVDQISYTSAAGLVRMREIIVELELLDNR